MYFLPVLKGGQYRIPMMAYSTRLYLCAEEFTTKNSKGHEDYSGGGSVLKSYHSNSLAKPMVHTGIVRHNAA